MNTCPCYPAFLRSISSLKDEMLTLLEVVDTAVKVALGALISELSTYSVTARKSKNDVCGYRFFYSLVILHDACASARSADRPSWNFSSFRRGFRIACCRHSSFARLATRRICLCFACAIRHGFLPTSHRRLLGKCRPETGNRVALFHRWTGHGIRLLGRLCVPDILELFLCVGR